MITRNTIGKHTPGPWELFETTNHEGDETISIRGNGEFIATMDVQSIKGEPYALPPNSAANARLIAAAPDLLEALKDIAETASYCDSWESFPEDQLNRAFAAISKAEGEIA